MKTISGIFKTYQDADDAIKRLAMNGYTTKSMSIIGQEEALMANNQHSDTADAAGKGAGIGGIIGLILGAAPMIIPGIGPIISAGTILGGGITGAGIGAAAGGLVGLFERWFGGEKPAEKVQEAIRNGHLLFAVETDDDRAHLVKGILQDHHAYMVQEHERVAA